MKKLFLFVVCATAFVAVNAQVKFGFKAGANFANITKIEGIKTKMKVGFNAGVQANIGINEMFSFAPELVYSSQGAKVSEVEGVEVDGTFENSYINVPLLLQFNHSSGFLLQTGPQVGFLMSAKAKSDGESDDMKDIMNSTDFAWAIGAGFATQSGFGFNARYNVGLSKIYSEEGAPSAKNSVIQVGLFYNLGGKADKK